MEKYLTMLANIIGFGVGMETVKRLGTLNNDSLILNV